MRDAVGILALQGGEDVNSSRVATTRAQEARVFPGLFSCSAAVGATPVGTVQAGVPSA